MSFEIAHFAVYIKRIRKYYITQENAHLFLSREDFEGYAISELER